MAGKNDDLIISVSTDTSTIKRSLTRLTGDIDAATGKITQKFNNLGKGIDKSVTTALQSRINAMVGIGTQATKEWSGALAQQGKEFENLRAKINPVFATVSRYKASIAEIKQAHALGAISANEMATAISRERQAALASIDAIKKRNAAIADTPNRGGSSFNTANIAAQFQDIAVTSAMGMSPLQIALQQGTQLSSVLTQMGGGPTGAIKGLAAAFASVISPVSLVTIGLVAASAAAIQFGSSFFEGSSETAEALKKESELIQNVASKWGDALPALKAYADERQRIIDQGEINDAAAVVAKDQYKDTAKAVSDLKIDVADLVVTLQQAGASSDEITPVQEAFKRLDKAMAEGKATAEDAKAVQLALVSAFLSSGVPAVAALAGKFYTLADAIGSANTAASKFSAEALLKDATKNVLPQLGALGGSPVLSAGGKFINEDDLQTKRANETKSLFEQEQEKADKLAEAARRKAEAAERRAGRGAERDANAYRDLVKSAQDRIEQMELEAQLVGTTGVAQDALRMKLELLQQATDKGRSITAEHRAEIEKLAATYGAAAEKVAFLKAQQDLAFEREQMFRSPTEQRVASQLQSAGIDANSAQGQMLANQIRLNESLATGRDLALDFASGFTSDLLNGVKATEALGNALGRLADKLLDMALNQAINSLFGNLAGTLTGGTTSGGGGLFSGIGKILGFAGGTNSAPGGLSIVGEKGPELMNVPKGAQIIPNHKLRNGPSMPRLAAAGSSSAGNITFAPVIDARGADSEAVARLEQVVAKQQQEFDARVLRTMTTAKKTRQWKP